MFQNTFTKNPDRVDDFFWHKNRTFPTETQPNKRIKKHDSSSGPADMDLKD